MTDTSVTSSTNRDYRKIARRIIHILWVAGITFVLTKVGITHLTYRHTTHIMHGAVVIQVTDATGTTDEYRGETNKAGDEIKTEIKTIKYIKRDGTADTALNENVKILGKTDDSTIGGIAQKLAGQYNSDNNKGWAIAYPSGIRLPISGYVMRNTMKWNIVDLKELPVKQHEGESYTDAVNRAADEVRWWHMRWTHGVSALIATACWILIFFLLWYVPRKLFRLFKLL